MFDAFGDDLTSLVFRIRLVHVFKVFGRSPQQVSCRKVKNFLLFFLNNSYTGSSFACTWSSQDKENFLDFLRFHVINLIIQKNVSPVSLEKVYFLKLVSDSLGI